MTQPPAPSGANPLLQILVYIGETDHWQHRPLYLAILDQARETGAARAVVLKGQAGYFGSGPVQTAGLVDVSPHLPLVVLILAEPARGQALLATLDDLVRPSGGLITVATVEGRGALAPLRPAGERGRPRVRDIMTTDVVTVPPTMPVADLLPLVLHRFYKALPVVDAEGKVLGMVTDTDLLEKAGLGARLSVIEAIQEQGGAGFAAWLEEVRARGQTARDVMGQRPEAVIGPDGSVADAARLLLRANVKRLPVVDRQGRLVGIVGRLDVLKAGTQAQPAARPEAGVAATAGAATLADVLQTDVPTVAVDTPLAAVTEALVGSRGARRAVVLASATNRHVAGIITDADLVKRAAGPARRGLLDLLGGGFSLLGAAPPTAASRTGEARVAGDVMTAPAVTAPATLGIPAAIDLMVGQQVKVLPVVDADGLFLGLVTRAALLSAVVPRLE